MSSPVASRSLSSFKYVYVLVFFLLLSGLFQPLITGNDGDMLVGGTLTLGLGLAGGVLLWRSARDKHDRFVYMGLGFGLVAASLYLVFLIS